MAKHWSTVVLLDGTDISNDLVGLLTLTARENEARLAVFSYRPPSGVIDASGWSGASVTITTTSQGLTRQRFSGRVNRPVFDVRTGLVEFNCSDNRDEKLAALTKVQIDAATPEAFWGAGVFTEETNFEYMRDRLKTLSASYDFNGDGVGVLTSWETKLIPDRVLKAHHVKRGSVSIDLSERASIINSVVIDFKYRYERLRHREIDFSYRHSSLGSWCIYLENPAELCFRSQIEESILGSGWILKSSVVYTDLPQDGLYGCQTGNIAFVMSDIERKKYCWQADFTLTKRWSQAMTETYQVTVHAPQSESQHGTIEKPRSYGLEASYDISEWEEYTEYSSPSGASVSPNGDLYFDKDDISAGDRPSFEGSIQAGIGMARADVLSSLRRNYVRLTTKYVDVDIELKDTIEISMLAGDLPTPTVAPFSVTGKVVEFIETLNVKSWKGSTQAKLAFFQSSGVAPTETPVAVPSAPDMNDAGPSGGTLVIGDYFGNHSTSPVYDSTWEGLIGNYQFVDIIGSWPQYPEEFAFTIGSTVDGDRQDRDVAAVSSFPIVVPNNQLVLNV